MPTQNKKISRRRRRAPQPSLVPRPLLPPRQTINMTYTDIRALTESVVATGAYYSYKLNDLFDPDFTGTGNQPVGYDQISNIYNRFRVLSVMIDVTYLTTANAAVVGFYPAFQSVLPASAFAWGCQPYARESMVNAGGPAVRLTQRVNLWDVFKVTKREYLTDADYTHLATSSPARNAYLHVFLRGFGTLAAPTVPISLRFTYVVQASSPLSLNIS